MMKKILLLYILAFTTVAVYSKGDQLLYKRADVPIKDRVEDLLKRMTLEEKIMQLDQRTYGDNDNVNNIEQNKREVSPLIGSLIYRSTSPVMKNKIQHRAMTETRLGIPILCGFDVIHGYRTIFPIPLAQSCSWNLKLVEESCRISAREAYLTGIDWTFSPMVDIARDSRWGRVAEGYGEDTYANTMYALASINGYQGEDMKDDYRIAACLKHYIGYSLSEGGRDYQYTDISSQTLWEILMPPFEAGIKHGAATVMSAFNDISGVPASANHYTLTEVLKDRWGFDGPVVSDWGAIGQLKAQGVAKDRKEAGMKALMAGVDIDMMDNIYVDYLKSLVEEGTIPVQRIDDAVRRVLRLKFRLGLFDKPYTPELPESTCYLQPSDRQIAYELAAESMVLLKNKKKILPLNNKNIRIALIGPMVSDSLHIMGSWFGKGMTKDVVSIVEGIKKEFANKAEIKYAKGCEFEGDNRTGFEAAETVARESDVIVLCLGEKKNWSGENGSRSSLSLPPIQEELMHLISQTGKPVVLVLSAGRPLELVRIHGLADAIVMMWQPGVEGGTALASILSGKSNPSGRLSISFPLTTNQQPVHYNRRQSSRPKMGLYQDIQKEPLYSFGYGLSYTDYKYGDLKISSERIKKEEKLVAEVEVDNVGVREGKETVFWYVTDPVSSISRPMKELKFFEKRVVKSGSKEVFRFEVIPERDLYFVNAQGEKIVESGEFQISVCDKKIKFEVIE